MTTSCFSISSQHNVSCPRYKTGQLTLALCGFNPLDVQFARFILSSKIAIICIHLTDKENGFSICSLPPWLFVCRLYPGCLELPGYTIRLGRETVNDCVLEEEYPCSRFNILLVRGMEEVLVLEQGPHDHYLALIIAM